MAVREAKPLRGIVAAACQVEGLTLSLPAPARHHDVLWVMTTLGLSHLPETQGFFDHRGIFLGRKAAKIVALNWEQITKEQFDDCPELYSEDLW